MGGWVGGLGGGEGAKWISGWKGLKWMKQLRGKRRVRGRSKGDHDVREKRTDWDRRYMF